MTAIEKRYATELIEQAAQLFGVSVHRLTSDFRDEPLPLMRMLIAQHLREKGMGYNAIGRMLNRDHATIITGIRKLEVRRHYPKANEVQVFAMWDKFISVK